MKANSVFRSRCVCQAQLPERSRYTHRTPDERAKVWYAYDWLAQGSAEQALAAYRAHVAAS